MSNTEKQYTMAKVIAKVEYKNKVYKSEVLIVSNDELSIKRSTDLAIEDVLEQIQEKVIDMYFSSNEVLRKRQILARDKAKEKMQIEYKH